MMNEWKEQPLRRCEIAWLDRVESGNVTLMSSTGTVCFESGVQLFNSHGIRTTKSYLSFDLEFWSAR